MTEFPTYQGPIITRSEALEKGLKRYFTGKPCPKGHIFQRHVSSKGCIACARQSPAHLRASKRWQQTSPKAKEVHKRFREKHRERRNADARARYAADPQKACDRVADYRRRNPDQDRNYYERTKDKSFEKARRRRAQKMQAEGEYKLSDVNRIYGQQKGKCANCRVQLRDKYHIDHIIPLSKGGTNYPKNLQILCGTCNRKKYNHDPIEWAQAQGRLL